MKYFKGYYQLELLKRAWERDLFSFFYESYLIVRFFLLAKHSCVFVLNKSDNVDKPVGDFNMDQLEIKSYHQWKDVESSLKIVFEREKKHIFWDVQYWLSQGARLWVGMIDGELAILLFNRNPIQEGAFFFPLTTNCGLVWNAVTLPKFRGRGLYPAMLRFISSSLFSEGIESIFISCYDYNTASIKGIKKAGFREIGRGVVRKRTGKGLWAPFAKPCRVN